MDKVRKLWPPTSDDFSVRLWATLASIAFNLLLWVVLLSGLEGAFWWLLPGFIPAAMVSAIAGWDMEGAAIHVVAAIVLILGNLGFYYLISWVIINMFTPSRNWWPEKRS